MLTSSYLPDDLRRRRLINSRQLAELLNFSQVHIRRLMHEGRLPRPVYVSERKLLWRMSDIESFLDGQKDAQGEGSIARKAHRVSESSGAGK